MLGWHASCTAALVCVSKNRLVKLGSCSPWLEMSKNMNRNMIKNPIIFVHEEGDMNLGRISPKNEAFLNAYKKYGFSTRTQMANAALNVLRQHLAKKRRMNWRKNALGAYVQSKPEYTWGQIDSENFEDI